MTIIRNIIYYRHGERIATQLQKYRLEMYEEGGRTKTLSLRIFSIEAPDFGRYTCVSSNTMGEDASVMELYGMYHK